MAGMLRPRRPQLTIFTAPADRVEEESQLHPLGSPLQARLTRTNELLCSSLLPPDRVEDATCMPERVANLHKGDLITVSAAFTTAAAALAPYVLRYHIGHMQGSIVPFTRWHG